MSNFKEIRQTIETALAGEEEQCAAEERGLGERRKALRHRRGLIERRRKALERFASAWQAIPQPEVEWPPVEMGQATAQQEQEQEDQNGVAAGG